MQVQIPIDSRVVNTFYNIPPIVDYEYSRLMKTINVKKQNKVLNALTIEGNEWANKE